LEKIVWQKHRKEKIFYGKLTEQKIHQNQDVTVTLKFQENSQDFLMKKPDFVPANGSYIWVKYDYSEPNSDLVLTDMGLAEGV